MDESSHFEHAAWRVSTFCDSGSCVEIALGQNLVGMRDSKNSAGSPLVFEAKEWLEFVSGVRNGEFDPPD